MGKTEKIKLELIPEEFSKSSILISVYVYTNHESQLHHYRGEEVWHFDGDLDELSKYSNYLSNTIFGNSVSDFSNCFLHIEDYGISPFLLKTILIKLLPAKAISISRMGHDKKSNKPNTSTLEKNSDLNHDNRIKIEQLQRITRDYDKIARDNLKQKKTIIELQQHKEILNNSILIVANIDFLVPRWRHESGKKVNNKLKVFKYDVSGVENGGFFPEKGVFFRVVDDKEYVYSGTIIGIIYQGTRTLENIEYDIGHLRKIKVNIWNKTKGIISFISEERIATVSFISVKNIDCHES